VTRFTGDVAATSSNNGTGLLIVEGDFQPGFEFSWRGIILAGSMTPSGGSGEGRTFTIAGVVATGLDNAGLALTLQNEASLDFDRCAAYEASSKVSYFRPLKNAWWEGG